MRKLDLIKSKDEHELKTVIKLDTKEQLDALGSVKSSIDTLYNVINEKEDYDFDKLYSQLEALNKTLDLNTPLSEIKQAVEANKLESVSIKEFGELLKAVKANKPLPVSIDLTRLEKAIVEVQQRIQEGPPIAQAPDEYQPIRRVIKQGNRLVFDDQPTPSRGGGGGGASVPTIQFAVISQSGAGTDTIVSAQASTRIKVVGYVVVLGSAGTVTFKSNTTALTGAMSFAANGGVSSAGTEHFPVFASASGEAINITTTGSAAMGHLSYVLE